MTPVEWLLLGVALGAVPSSRLGALVVAIVAKRAGVKPRQIEKYEEATDS